MFEQKVKTASSLIWILHKTYERLEYLPVNSDSDSIATKQVKSNSFITCTDIQRKIHVFLYMHKS